MILITGWIYYGAILAPPPPPPRKIRNEIAIKSIQGDSVSNHPKKMKFETVPPPQILMKIYTFGLFGQKRRFAK